VGKEEVEEDYDFADEAKEDVVDVFDADFNDSETESDEDEGERAEKELKKFAKQGARARQQKAGGYIEPGTRAPKPFVSAEQKKRRKKSGERSACSRQL
jgi:hypothetical protein